uniref:Uncharacterized protein n=1 Tax=Leptocylindrus danicus TaxID=163516 RepID=A0A7S2KZM1_9STRA
METHLSIEIWAEVKGGTGFNRIVATIPNSFVLAASRREVWVFVAYVSDKILVVQGPPIVYGKLQHIVATYDAEKAVLYVNGHLVGSTHLREESADNKINEELGDMAGFFFDKDTCDNHKPSVGSAKRKNLLSVGAAPKSLGKLHGSNFFNGNLAHFSIYSHCLTADDVRRHVRASQQINLIESARLSSQAKAKFEQAIDIAPSNERFIKEYCAHLCCSIGNDVDFQTSDAFHGIKNAIYRLDKINHLDGLVQLLRVLPSKSSYSEMVCGLYNSIISRNPCFFSQTKYMSLSELANIPFKFSLHNTNNSDKIAVAASIFRVVLSDRTLSSVYSSDLHWIPHIENDAVVVSLVCQAFQGNPDAIDLTVLDDCSTANDCDLIILGKSCLQVRSFKISACKNISNEAIGFALGKWSVYLQKLSLSKLPISGATFSSLQCCPNMMVLRLESCDQVDDQVLLTIIQTCPKLKEVNVDRCFLVSDTFLRSAGEYLVLLEILSVSWCSISDVGLKDFCKSSVSSRLKYLDISNCGNLSSDGVMKIAACTELSHISLNGLGDCNDSCIGEILASCHKIETINLKNTNPTNQCFKDLCLPALKNINISGCFNLSDLSWLQNSNCLECLTACGVNLLTSEIVKNSVVKMTCLKYINFASCHLFTDRLITDALSSNSALQTSLAEINLSGCIRITDAGVLYLTENFRNIVSLSLEGCRRITDKSTKHIADNLMMLEKLNLNGCKGISESKLKAMEELFGRN